MKILFSIAFALASLHSLGQGNSNVLINGSPQFKGAFVFFPLTGDSINLENPDLFNLLRQNARKRIFYCGYHDEKSKLYDLDSTVLQDGVINFTIPDPLFYQNLYKSRVCPLCHKIVNVVPYVYGKPGSGLIKMANEGKIKLAGCSLSNTSPRFYCKVDKLEF